MSTWYDEMPAGASNSKTALPDWIVTVPGSVSIATANTASAASW
jgi:hypothetical protein